MIRILIVDDQKSIRDRIKALLEPEQDFEVVGTADDGRTAIEQVKTLQPDVVLIDMEMPGLDGISATQIICQDSASTKVLVLSGYDSHDYVAKSLSAGAKGYLLKNTPTKELYSKQINYCKLGRGTKPNKNQLAVGFHFVQPNLRKVKFLAVGSIEEAIRSVYKGYAQIGPELLEKIISGVERSHSVMIGRTSDRTMSDDKPLRVYPSSEENHISEDSGQIQISKTSSLVAPGAKESEASLIPSTPAPLSQINVSEDTLAPIEEKEFLPSVSVWTTLGGIFISSAVAIALFLGSIIQYKITIKTKAIVRPAGELRLVQSSIEGRVMSISLERNQTVKKGDLIASIDDSRLQTKKSQLETNIRQAQLQLAQINAQISAQDSRILAESDRINRAVAASVAELRRSQREYRDRGIISNADVEEAEANLRIAQQEFQRAQTQLKSARANLRATEAGLETARAQKKRYNPIVEAGALSMNQLEEVRLAVKRQEQELEVQKATVEAQKQTIEQQQKAVEAAVAKLKRAKAALDPSNAEVAIASEKIRQEKATGVATLSTLNKERESLIQQRIQIQNQLQRDRKELQQIEIDLSQTSITATADGIIAKLNLRNPGQTVRPGEEIAQIIPTNAPLVLKASVSPKHISKLAKGQKVQMRVSACPYPDYGTLGGVVSHISEDTIQPQSIGSSAVSSTSKTSKKGGDNGLYEVTIRPDKLMLGQGKNQCPIQLGMEGKADIISREETALKFFLRKARLFTNF
ncbi:MAG: response regulator [Calothrix sp. MO_167.B12]|nr:response regulator [Calothrix sp. MO_167.B12]